MSAEAWARSWSQPWSQPWDAALDRLEQGLDRVGLQLAAGDPAGPVAGLLPLPEVDGDLPEHLGDRARTLLARTDALAHRVSGELARTRRELREVAERTPDGTPVTRRGPRHPAFLDTRA